MKKQYLVIAAIAVIGVALHWLLYTSPFGRTLEHSAFDSWFNVEQWIYSLKNERPARPSEVVLIAMDEASFDPLGISFTQAWPRAVHGALLERLHELGAEKVVFDILFLGPTTPENDQKLAYGLSLLPTVIGAELPPRPDETESVSYYTEELQIPYEPFLEVSELGLVGYRLTDGKVRHFFNERPSEFFPDLKSIALEAVEGLVRNSDLPDDNDYIRFYGPSDTILTLSYYQVLESGSEKFNQLLSKYIKNKIVFVALKSRTETGYAQKDTFRVPFWGDSIYGGEIHATSAVNLLRGDWIRRADFTREIRYLSLAGFFSLVLLFSLRPIPGAVFVLGILMTWAVTAYLSFQMDLFLPGLTLVGFILPVSYTGSILYYYFNVKKDQLKILKAISVYVGPQMAKEVAHSDFKLALGGHEVEATVMFTDIAGFTPISESMSPSEVATMLNTYFAEVMEVVFDHKGTLLKFIGDAVFVIWGAPLDQEDQGDLSLATALDIQKRVEIFNQKSPYPALHTRIGLNTGRMVFGNLGTTQRYDYTAIGDEVNLGARVEGINKYFGTTILLTEATREKLTNSDLLLPMGSVKVVGKDRPVELYSPLRELMDDKSVIKWESAIGAFRNRGWEEARILFEEVAAAAPVLEKAKERYCEDILKFLTEPPGENWAGELIFSRK